MLPVEPQGAGSDRHYGHLLSGPPAYRPHTPWPPLMAVAATLLILMVSMVAAVTAAEWVGGAGQGGDIVASAGLPLAASLVGSQTAAVLLTLLAARAFGGQPRAVLALGPPAGGLSVYLGAFALMVALTSAFTLAVWMLDPETVAGDLAPFTGLLRSPFWWLALLAIGVGAPLMEELIFRGFLFSALAQSRLGMPGASLVTSAAWTVLHASYSLAGLAEVFAIGLFFAWVVWRTGSARVTIFCHGAYNTSVALLLMTGAFPSPAGAGAG